MFNRKKYMKKYRQDHKEKRNGQLRNRYKTDLRFNLNEKIRRLILHSLKGSKPNRNWKDLVGYNLNDLIKRLKKTIPEGYTWEDFLDGRLQFDHIIPVSAFNFTTPENIDFKRCWTLDNLRLLPAIENKIKSAKLNKPFQLALKI